MKVIAYTALHYGKDYLAYAIRSIIDHVDEYHVLYASEGSHGHRNSARCPETRGELQTIAREAAGSKLHWHDGIWEHEGKQRESIHQYVPDADVVLVLDADEIWPEILVASSVSLPERVYWYPKRLRMPMIHFWRSFNKVILHDPAYPVRVIYPKREGNEEATHNIPLGQYINHMGYAQRPEIVEYKQLVHGHRNEWRHDVDWFNDVFMANRQTDCHPVGSDAWNPEPVNPLDYLPEWMQEHPYYGMEVIE